MCKILSNKIRTSNDGLVDRSRLYIIKEPVQHPVKRKTSTEQYIISTQKDICRKVDEDDWWEGGRPNESTTTTNVSLGGGVPQCKPMNVSLEGELPRFKCKLLDVSCRCEGGGTNTVSSGERNLTLTVFVSLQGRETTTTTECAWRAYGLRLNRIW